MSDYAFSEAKKVSIWRGDGEKCFYCRIPVAYSELQIDHIVAERIPPDTLADLRSNILPPNFEINSISNWVTCHQGCNVRKSDLVFEPKALLYFIEIASNRAENVQKIMDDFKLEKKNGRLLSTLRVRIEKGHLDQAAVLAVLGNLPASKQTGADPWVVAFGANFYDPLPEDAPKRDPQLSDWLLKRLEIDLASTGAVFRRVDDERSGEGISVRFAFWLLDLDRITESIDFCWDVLAVQRYSEVFETPADDLLERAVVSRYDEIVHTAPSSDPGGRVARTGVQLSDGTGTFNTKGHLRGTQVPINFSEFAEEIRNLSPTGPTDQELQNFLLEDSGKTRVYYAPFDWINAEARLIVVGITPGKDSMLNAFRAAASALRSGETLEEASKRGRRVGSFSNMRDKMAQMLDDIGIPESLRIERSEELFGAHYNLLHPTACIRHPVFVFNKRKQRWMNYTGHSPQLLRWPTSIRYIESFLAEELRQIPEALIVPCGEAVGSALQHLVEKKLLHGDRCLFGFPHASGANGHREKFFLERKEQLRRTVAKWQRST
jgi:hypothetical protein